MNIQPQFYNRIQLLVAGLGGLLYGVDVGIIAGALPYLEATSGLNAAQLSFVVAAVLMGTVISTLFAGFLSDRLGRKTVMIASGVLFAISIPLIALSHGYEPLILGRLCQGISAGLIGVVVPLYLAECLTPDQRGQGTAIFQWLLTIGIVVAAIVGMYFSLRVDEVAKAGNPQLLFAFKDHAWRGIFWVSLPPGVLFVIGSIWVAESPRWLFMRHKTNSALEALLRSREPDQARIELEEMERSREAESANTGGQREAESLLKRKYAIPFLLACLILGLNQTTGINSIIGYNTAILIQSGLTDVQAHWGYILFTLVNALATVIGVLLVDRKGRKFLLSIGTAGVVVALIFSAILFRRSERQRVDLPQAVQALLSRPDGVKTTVTPEQEQQWLIDAGRPDLAGRPAAMTVIYSCGDFSASTPVVRFNQAEPAEVSIERSSCVPANRVLAFFSKPFGDLNHSRNAPLEIQHALITPLPDAQNGWFVAVCLFLFVAFYAMGPGICVWLALSELMPTRIRSNGMSVALLINEAIASFIAAVFLPTVGRFGYGMMFFGFAGFTVLYFIIVTFFLPETKGRTLEEIEDYFSAPSGGA
jgi:MFS transporter, SP family, solute carrier family 2 (myo-inositol transporter), member 13